MLKPLMLAISLSLLAVACGGGQEQPATGEDAKMDESKPAEGGGDMAKPEEGAGAGEAKPEEGAAPTEGGGEATEEAPK